MLASDGKSPSAILNALTYDTARSASPGTTPDPKRYRDARQLYRTMGLLYEDPSTATLVVTELGLAVARWRSVINEHNCRVLGRHAAQALGACQLANPTREGSKYSSNVRVFPFAFIWRAMLALDNRISSDELNRAIFKTENDKDLSDAILAIRHARETGNISSLGPETISEQAKNDRILVWMSWASFGWTLITDKRASKSGDYEINPKNRRLIRDAASIIHRHRDFSSEPEYVEHVSKCAGLPKDLR